MMDTILIDMEPQRQPVGCLDTKTCKTCGHHKVEEVSGREYCETMWLPTPGLDCPGWATHDILHWSKE